MFTFTAHDVTGMEKTKEIIIVDIILPRSWGGGRCAQGMGSIAQEEEENLLQLNRIA